MPRSDPLPVAEEEHESWCIWTMIQSTERSARRRGQGPAQPARSALPRCSRGRRGRCPGAMAGLPVLAAGVSAAGPDTSGPASWYTTSSASRETNRADPTWNEYQRPLEPGRPVVRQEVAGQVGRVALRAVVELDLVIPGARHPGPERRRSLVVVAEVPPHLGLDRGVEVRVAEVPVEQVEQGLERFDRLDRVGALPVRENPRGVRRGQVPEAGEPEGHPAFGRGAHAALHRRGAVAEIVRRHRVRVARVRPQARDPRMVGPHGLPVQPVRVAAGVRRDHLVPAAPLEQHPGPHRPPR